MLDRLTTGPSDISYSDLSEFSAAAIRRAANQTAAAAKTANTTLPIRTTIIGAVSKAGGLAKACQAYAKRAPAARARICLSPQPGLRDHSMIAMTAAASTTKMVSVGSTAVGGWGAMTKMLAAKAATMPTSHAPGAP